MKSDPVQNWNMAFDYFKIASFQQEGGGDAEDHFNQNGSVFIAFCQQIICPLSLPRAVGKYTFACKTVYCLRPVYYQSLK